jgi:hypothetical protein
MSLTEDMVRLTRTMREAHDNRVTEVGAQRAAAGKQLADLQAEHREMATAQRKELQQFAETLRQNVSTLIHDLDVERAALNAEQRRRLDAFKRDLRQDMANFFQERTAERRAANASQRQSLDEFMSALRERTNSFLTDVHAARMAIHADQSSAHQAWQQFAAVQQQSRAGNSMPSADAEQHDEFNTKTRQRRSGKRQQKTPQE